MYIYLIRNTVNNKFYVGQTVLQPNVRFSQHKQSGNNVNKKVCVIGRAINKHGWANFTRHVLEVCRSQDELDLAEKSWISHYDCLVPNGYNVDMGGRGNGVKTDATRKKMSESKMGHATTDEAKRKLSKAHKGKKRPPEVVEAIREGKKRRSLEMKKLGITSTAAVRCGPEKHTEEVKAKIAASLRGRKMSAESRAKRDATYIKKRADKALIAHLAH